MSTSHFTSGVEGNVKVNVASLEATDIKASTKVKAGSYIQLGSHIYIHFGSAGSESDVAAAATTVDASCRGSIYLSDSSPGEIYIMRTDSTASLLRDIA